MTNICNFCYKEFTRWGHPRAGSVYKFCSRKCYHDSMTIFLNCKTCGKEFKRSSNGVLKYCSKECKNNGEWGKTIKTINIGRKHSESTRILRSKIAKETKVWKVLFKPEVREKAIANAIKTNQSRPSPLRGRKAEWATGENNFNWKGGITNQNKLDRERFRATFLMDVFKRDQFKCQMCGASQDLQADHIKRWSKYPELRFDIDNCRTLCKSCHYLVTYGREIPDASMAWGHNFKYYQKERVQKFLP